MTEDYTQYDINEVVKKYEAYYEEDSDAVEGLTRLVGKAFTEAVKVIVEKGENIGHKNREEYEIYVQMQKVVKDGSYLRLIRDELRAYMRKACSSDISVINSSSDDELDEAITSNNISFSMLIGIYDQFHDQRFKQSLQEEDKPGEEYSVKQPEKKTLPEEGENPA